MGRGPVREPAPPEPEPLVTAAHQSRATAVAERSTPQEVEPSVPEAEPESEPAPAAQPEQEPEQEAEPEVESQPEPESQVESQPEAEPESQAEPGIEAELQPEPELVPELKVRYSVVFSTSNCYYYYKVIVIALS
jgi:hypothetical protein